MHISYPKELRAQAKLEGRELFTIHTRHITAQGMADEQLEEDLIKALLAYQERKKGKHG